MVDEYGEGEEQLGASEAQGPMIGEDVPLGETIEVEEVIIPIDIEGVASVRAAPARRARRWAMRALAIGGVAAAACGVAIAVRKYLER